VAAQKRHPTVPTLVHRPGIAVPPVAKAGPDTSTSNHRELFPEVLRAESGGGRSVAEAWRRGASRKRIEIVGVNRRGWWEKLPSEKFAKKIKSGEPSLADLFSASARNHLPQDFFQDLPADRRRQLRDVLPGVVFDQICTHNFPRNGMPMGDRLPHRHSAGFAM